MAKIAVDFDDTLVLSNNQELVPVPGAKEALQKLREYGHEVIIYTCRTGIAARVGDLDIESAYIAESLERLGIPFDYLYEGEKLVADFYIDDRAISFKGSWPQTLSELEKRCKKNLSA